MPRIKPLSEAQNHRCCYCEHEMVFDVETIVDQHKRATRDHYIARAAGGKNGHNLVAACLLCNHMRGDLPAMTYYNLMRKWFAADPSLRGRWHRTDRAERYIFKQECIRALESHLRKRARQSVEHAFRHLMLLTREGHHLHRTA